MSAVNDEVKVQSDVTAISNAAVEAATPSPYDPIDESVITVNGHALSTTVVKFGLRVIGLF